MIKNRKNIANYLEKCKLLIYNLLKKENIYSILLISILLMLCVNIGLKKVITVDYIPIDGDFQNYNVWRRLLDGQIPFKDFTVYLGIGHLLLGSLITGLLGNTFKMSMVTSYTLTAILSIAIIITISYLIIKNINIALSIAVIIFLSIQNKFLWFSDFVYTEFWDGLNSIFSPGNSARIIRSGVVLFVVWSVLLCSFLIEKKYKKLEDHTKKNTALIISISAISGIGILYSNDVGVSSYISLSIIYLFFLIKKIGFHKKIFKYIIFYVFISIFVLIIAILILTHGYLNSWIEFTLSAGNFQKWYYGYMESDKIYYIYQLAFSPMQYAAIIIIIYNFYKILSNRKLDIKDEIFSGMITYILLTSIISSNLYKIVSGGSSTELLSLCTFSVIISYICKFIYYFIKRTFYLQDRYWISKAYKLIILTFCISFTMPQLFETLKSSVSDKPGVYIEALDGNLTSLGNDINKILEYTKNTEIFSTYASAVETIKGDFQPTGTDYIIHVLGSKARQNYLKNFMEGNYKFVQTVNREFTPWELWIESSNWYFYKELYKNYMPTLTTSYSILWEPVKKINLIDENINYKIEKISNSDYKILCTAESNLNALVDISINYSSYYSNGFLNNGVINRSVHVTDVTKMSVYNDDHVNYFIPNKSGGYNIPITLTDGKGEIIISSYPQRDTLLEINNIKVNEVIANPFSDIQVNDMQVNDMTDDNWLDGVSRKSNTLLFSNTSFNSKQLTNAKSLLSGNVEASIEAIQEVDQQWIQVNIKGDKEAFKYPSRIKVVKN